MQFILLLIAVLVFIFVLPVRIAVLNPHLTIGYGFSDLFNFFRYAKWNIAPCGTITAYTGLFGRGKTLSAVHYVTRYYHRYNNKKVWDFGRKKFVMQYVNVLSNVELSIPYQKFVSMNQIVDIADKVAKYNEENNCRLITIVLGDEFSTQLNSRNFKSNLDALMLNSILTCRHHGISLIYTAQRFGHVDALLRQVTSDVIECHKIWRFQCQYVYDAWEMENAGSPLLIKPRARKGFFVRNKDFDAYNTLAVVDNFIKEWKIGGMLNEELILTLQGNSGSDLDKATTIRKRFRRNRTK